MTERLDQIEKILLANTSQIATLLEGQIKLQESQIRLQAAQVRTQEQLDRLTADVRASIEDLVELGTTTFELASENAGFIRGLQVENRRILRELRDQRRG